jgi:membrane protein
LIIVIAVAGLAFGRQAVQGEISQQIAGLVGEQSAKVVESMIASAAHKGTGIIATVVGIVTLFVGAVGVFTELQSALDTIWDVEPKPGRGVWYMFKSRVLSFGMIVGIAFVLLVSLVVSAGLSALGKFVSGRFADFEWLWHILNIVVSFGIVTLLFGLIFKVLPDVRLRWRDVSIGAAVTAALFTIGKFLIGLYLGKSSVSSSYGAAGSVIIVLLWVYYSAQIVFLGAQFTQVWASRHGRRMEPSHDAVRVDHLSVHTPEGAAI